MNTIRKLQHKDTAEVGEEKRPNRSDLTHRLPAEFVGTMALVTAAGGLETLAVAYAGEFGIAVRSLGPALVIMAFVYGFGGVSGAHFNPMATLAFVLRKD